MDRNECSNFIDFSNFVPVLRPHIGLVFQRNCYHFKITPMRPNRLPHINQIRIKMFVNASAPRQRALRRQNTERNDRQFRLENVKRNRVTGCWPLLRNTFQEIPEKGREILANDENSDNNRVYGTSSILIITYGLWPMAGIWLGRFLKILCIRWKRLCRVDFIFIISILLRDRFFFVLILRSCET